ncbi:MAG: hypothetical protein KW788_02005 [Candidatus Doudnabacteria bacterium]|nr:hypothetical protein [Candidatus Doudnabacteria bacterium]
MAKKFQMRAQVTTYVGDKLVTRHVVYVNGVWRDKAGEIYSDRFVDFCRRQTTAAKAARR